MYRKELNERNPLRLFEHSINGGVGPGNIGVVVARHGIGKTAFLVGIALDEAMRGRKTLHVSLDKTVDHIREFYDEIFMDLAHSAHLEDIPASGSRWSVTA
jgi:KaiC/GvpD/RAD55 family RecA-like ATPase